MKENWYSDFCGSNLILNLLWFRLFETALTEIPYQSYGLYLNENQSWERALIYAWNKNKHGHLIAVQHSTVRFWDLRYFEKNSIDSNKEIKLHYNIHDFYFNVLNGKNTKINSGEFNLKIERTKEPILDWQEWARKVLWYGHRRGNYLYEFSSMKKNLAENK